MERICIDEETVRRLSRMAYGHEFWLEGCVKKGKEISVHGLFGHKLASDGPMPEKYTNATLYDDKGPVAAPKKEIVKKPEGWKFTFKDGGAAVYTMYLDSESYWVFTDEGMKMGTRRDYDKVNKSNAFNITAKKIISKDGTDPGKVMHAMLEIMPKAAAFKVGSEAKMKILYEGKPAGGLKCSVFNRNWQDVKSINTDEKGRLKFEVDEPGTYIVIARYADKEKFVEDEYDETVFVTTLTFDAE